PRVRGHHDAARRRADRRPARGLASPALEGLRAGRQVAAEIHHRAAQADSLARALLAPPGVLALRPSAEHGRVRARRVRAGAHGLPGPAILGTRYAAVARSRDPGPRRPA